MDRRSFLVAGAALFGGCSSLSGPSTPTPRPTETPTSASAARDRLVGYLEQRDIVVEELVREGSTVALTYETTRTDYNELGAEIGTIAGAYFREVADGWDVERLDALVLRDGERIATWHAKSAWLREYQNGEITGEELSLRVLQTLERA